MSGATGAGYETGQVGAAVGPPIAFWTFDELRHGNTVAPTPGAITTVLSLGQPSQQDNRVGEGKLSRSMATIIMSCLVSFQNW